MTSIPGGGQVTVIGNPLMSATGSGKNYFENAGSGVFASGRKSFSGSSATLSVSIQFDAHLSEMIKQAGLRAPYAIGRAIDEVGNKTRTQVVKAVAKQAGVKQGKVRGVLTTHQAMGAGNGKYEIIARDVTLSLKEFAPRQTKKGVSAAPWGKRHVFPHTFIGPNGHVFVRAMQGNKRAGRLPIHKLFGPAIPKEMVKGEAEKTFHRTTETLLPVALDKWLGREIEKAAQGAR